MTNGHWWQKAPLGRWVDGDSVHKSYRRFWVHSPYQFLVIRYSEVASEAISGKTATGCLSQALSVFFFFYIQDCDSLHIYMPYISPCWCDEPARYLDIHCSNCSETKNNFEQCMSEYRAGVSQLLLL